MVSELDTGRCTRVRTLAPRGVACEILHQLGRVWKPTSSGHVLKTLGGGPKRKTRKRQYLLAVSLS